MKARKKERKKIEKKEREQKVFIPPKPRIKGYATTILSTWVVNLFGVYADRTGGVGGGGGD